MMNKLGQLSSPFTYIFALVVGGIIFLFFIGFAYQFISLSGSLSAAETVSALKDEFAAFSVSDSAEKTLDYGQDFSFQIFEGQISSGGQSQGIETIIFSPFSLEGDVLYLATKSVELPYRVANIFYLADGQTAYILVSDSGSHAVVEDYLNSYTALPKNFPIVHTSLSELSQQSQDIVGYASGFSNVRFVFFMDSSTVPNSFSSSFPDAEKIFISSTDASYSSGEVQYSDGTVLYLNEALLFAAIFSSNAESYTYSFDQVLERLQVVTGVYAEKAKLFSARLPACNYGQVKSSLTSYRSLVGSSDSPQVYQQSMRAVVEGNKVLGGECPALF